MCIRDRFYYYVYNIVFSEALYISSAHIITETRSELMLSTISSQKHKHLHDPFSNTVPPIALVNSHDCKLMNSKSVN